MSKIQKVLRIYFQRKGKKVISEQTIADAILDHIVHDAHRIELIVESLRKRYRMKKEMK